MAKTRNIKKQLIGMEDILTGVGPEQQDRAQSTVTVHKVDVPFAVDTIAAMQDLDVAKYTRARVYDGTRFGTDFVYDPNDASGTPSNNGPGSWFSYVPAPGNATLFANVAQMEAAPDLTVGQFVRTEGYYTPGDGGGNDYEIVAGTGTDDGGSFIDLPGSGLQAKGLFLRVVNVVQFGADPADDGINNRNAFLAVLNTDFSQIDLLGNTYKTGINTDTEKEELDRRFFNGEISGLNNQGNTGLVQTRTEYADYNVSRPRTKSPELSWQDKRVLWLGTSIPHQGVGVDGYPEIFGQTLGCTVANLAWSGSHAGYDVDGDAFSIETVKALSMTEDDRQAGLALYGGSSAYDDSFDLVTKASQMTCDYRIAAQFATGSYDVVFLDHNHNDRRREFGTLSPDSFSISSIVTGATTTINYSGSGLAVGDSVYLEVAGISNLNYAAARVQSASSGQIVLNIDSSAYVGTFTSGTVFIVDKSTIYGAWDFLIAFIKNASIVYGQGDAKIILSGAPSQHTNDADIDYHIWSNGEALKRVAEKWDLSFFDIGFLYDIKKHDHLTYFPDAVHPADLATRQSLANYWIAWAQGGTTPTTNPDFYLANAQTLKLDQREPLYSVYDDKYGIRSQVVSGTTNIITEDFSGGLGAWTTVGTAPTIVVAPWNGSEFAIECPSTSGTPTSYLQQDIAIGNHPTLQFDLWLPDVIGQAPSGPNKTVDIVQLRTPGAAYVVQLLVSESAIRPRVQYFKASNVDLTTPEQLSINLDAGTQYTFNVDIVKSDGVGPGFLLFTVNGQIFSRVQIDNDLQNTLTRTRIGVISSNTGQNFTAYIGNYILDNKTLSDYTQRFTGSFTAQSGETVTVVNGIIISAV